MRALVVHSFQQAPRWVAFPRPMPAPGSDDVLVAVRAAPVTNLVRAIASGRHYSVASGAALPFVAGTEGVGELADGRRVFFFMASKPHGAIAEYTLVRRELCIPVPDLLGDVAAAALANPIMSAWAALTRRAKLQAGEGVLVNGATGAAGKVAVRIARHLGAARIVATGRDADTLERLRVSGDADAVVSLRQPKDALVPALARAMADNRVSVVLDYVYGPAAEAVLAAVSSLGSAAAPEGRTLRFVQIGSIGGGTISMPADPLRSANLSLMGSGLGSVAVPELLADIGAGLQVATRLQLNVDTVVVPMANAEAAWAKEGDRQRLVLSNP
jgi:NADPH:quinone reductase-like Zn-dependent oxidoreductase